VIVYAGCPFLVECEEQLLRELIHNGVVIPNPPAQRHLVLRIRGTEVELTPIQEEMALAWAKKQDTPYAEDPVFVRNFLDNFSEELGISPRLELDEVDFGPAVSVVEAERRARARLTREERKALAAERKAAREELRAQYGYATVNGQRVELANYVVEPSGIFMGRGEHPLRGRWKEGASQREITLNLSPEAPRPAGDWEEIVWQPESLWVARWQDKLSGKLKYVWLSDTAPVKQKREAAKFDQAIELHQNLGAVRAAIREDLGNEDPKLRMIATACYLIDALCLRVGDEKDADEADTVGATTLRPEHVTLHSDGSAEFCFLGKDSVEWHKELNLPQAVYRNLDELLRSPHLSDSDAGPDGQGTLPQARPQLFPDIGSRDVNAYLTDLLPGLTAKVFRTHHATEQVQLRLAASEVEADDPEYKKWAAAVEANLQSAIVCNHTKQEPANWEARRERAEERRGRILERLAKAEANLHKARSALEELTSSLPELEAITSPALRERRLAAYGRKVARAEKRIERAHDRVARAQQALDKFDTREGMMARKRTWNLGTSLKSYIDPRVYYEWGQLVDYDVLEKYYPKALRRKFAWVRAWELEDAEGTHELQAEDAEAEESAATRALGKGDNG
jgi:DNA topoisomerase-1